jgi:hypothetical protein
MGVKRGDDFHIDEWIEEVFPSVRELRLEDKTEQKELRREDPLDLKELIKKELPDLSQVRLVIAEQTKRLERQTAGILALGLLGVVTVVTMVGILSASRWPIVKEALTILVPLLASTVGYYFGASGSQ